MESKTDRISLGKLLVERNLVTQKELDEALNEQEKKGDYLERFSLRKK